MPVSGQVPTFRWVSLPDCASAPFTAWAKTTPGLGALLPQVIFTGISFGKCASRLIEGSCGKAQVSGVQTMAFTPASLNCWATRSACFSPSMSSGVHTTLHRTAVRHGDARRRCLGNGVDDIDRAFTRRLSMRGSPAAQTPKVTTAGLSSLIS